MEKKPSEVAADFLSFLETAKREYASAYDTVGREDARLQTLVHDIEFAEDSELYEAGINLRQSRRNRREAKDRTLLYRAIHNFCEDKQGQGLIKALKKVQGEQESQEKYLFGEREFKNRVE